MRIEKYFFTVLLLFAITNGDNSISNSDLENNNYIGIGVGYTSGVGISYRRWINSSYGFQVNLFPYYGETEYPASLKSDTDGVYNGSSEEYIISIGGTVMKNIEKFKYGRTLFLSCCSLFI